MQNHYEISSKNHFWIRNMRNLTKSRKSDMSGPAKTCPGGPIRAHIWAHIWAHKRPYGLQPGPGPQDSTRLHSGRGGAWLHIGPFKKPY